MLVVKSDGTLWVWGYGVLGTGTGDSAQYTPQRIGLDTDWDMVSTSGMHTMAVKSDGSLWGWGDISGVGSLVSTPLRIGTDKGWVGVIARSAYSVGLKGDGTLWEWGWDVQQSPQKIGLDHDWITVSAGDAKSSTLAIKADGTLWAWGENLRGTLGVGDTQPHWEPTQVGSSGDWATVATNDNFTMALKRDGSLWGWGWDSAGQLGLEEFSDFQVSPLQISDEKTWIAIAIGSEHALALKADGSLWAWGRNSHAQGGIGHRQFRIGYTQVGTDTDWQAVAAGDNVSFALKKDGDYYFWGNDSLGFGKAPAYKPVAIADPANWKTMDVGKSFSVGVKNDGTLWSWGQNFHGQLGIGDPTDTLDRLIPTRIGEGSSWVAVDGGYAHAVALRADGTLWSWGENYWGELGRGVGGLGEFSVIPEQVIADGEWIAVSAGYGHNLALKNDATLWAWGYNRDGQLGIGLDPDPSTPHPRPIQVGTDSDWNQISAGSFYSLAIKSDGTLWAWGDNRFGQAGNEGGDHPTRIGSESDWASAKAGNFFSMATKTDGTLWVWGQVDPILSQYQTPVPTLLNKPVGKEEVPWLAGSPGYDYAMAIMADGTLWAWGNNSGGALGTGNSTGWFTNSPVQIGTDTDWKTVVADPYYDSTANRPHTLALKNDGTLFSWGNKTYGQLGNGTYGFQMVPRRIDDIFTSYVLWTRRNTGQAALWKINPDAMPGTIPVWGSAYLFSSSGVGGPWQATSYQHVNASTSYVLWTRSDTGQAALWQVNPGAMPGTIPITRSTYLYSSSGVGGPWQATSYQHVDDARGYVLWTRSDTGQAALWEIHPGTGARISSMYLSPSSGVGGPWQATDYLHVDDARGHVLWTRSDTGQAALWEINPGTGARISSAYLHSPSGVGGSWQATGFAP